LITIPQGVAAAGATAYGLHDRGIPVLDIMLDSVLDPMPGEAGVTRHVVFANAALRLDLLVRWAGVAEVLWTPGSWACVEVLDGHGNTVMTSSPAGGRTFVRGVGPGLATLRLRREVTDGGVIRTAWVLI